MKEDRESLLSTHDKLNRRLKTGEGREGRGALKREAIQ